MDININEIVTEVIRRYNFLGNVFASVEIVPDYNCYEYHGNPSMSATRTRISYHPNFLSTLNREQQIFTFAHEACHILLKHMDRAKNRIPELWNIAADAIINAQLKKDNFELVDGCVDRSDAINYSTERYYQKLLEEEQYQEDNKNKNNSSSSFNENDAQNSRNSNSDSSSETENFKKYDAGHDTHSNWYIEEKELEESQKNTQDNDKSEEQLQGKESNTNTKEEYDDTKVFRENRKKEKERLEKLRKNLVKQMLAAGDNTNSNILSLGLVGEKTNLIPWQRLLIDATKIEEDWSFLNATIEYGVVIPHLEKQPQPETEILIDTSGSVSDSLVRNFLRECKSLLQTSEIRVGCFDTRFYGFQDIRSEEDIDNFIITGRGGTNFNVAVEAFTGRAENKIILTDGKAPMPNKELNVIWIVYGSEKISPKGGRVIYISEEQLQELNIVLEKNQRKK